MKKTITLLLLISSISLASANNKTVYMALDFENDGYNIDLELCDLGEKSYRLEFKFKKNILRTDVTYAGFIRGDSLSIESESHTINFSSAIIESKSEVHIYLKESEFKKLGKSGSANIYINSRLFDEDLIINTYKKTQPVYDSRNPYRPLPGVMESNAFVYVKPMLRINLNNADSFIKKCNVKYKKHWAEQKRKNKQRDLKFKKEFKKAYSNAQSGDAKSQYLVAVAYIKGLGTLKDYKKGLNWLNKAADQGYASAQSDLGLIYATGKAGVLKDMNKAKLWIEKGHNNGDPKAKKYWDKFELWKY